jgi:acetoin utilization deacetylase AcuC-like enzyme
MPIPLLYDPRHAAHIPPVEYDQGKLMEALELPCRVEDIRRRLLAAGLAVEAPPAPQTTVGHLAAVHAPELLDFLQQASAEAARRGTYIFPEFFPRRAEMRRSPRVLTGRAGMFCTDNYIPIGPATWDAACAAAGLALAGAGLLLQGGRAAYALCRPPGHHAGRDFIGGYCYLNNAALAADRLKSRGPVAVLDIDYHHGNGTQSIFWDDPQVFFASLHITPELHYPYYTGYPDETGGQNAPHTNLNIPLPHGTTPAEYLAALDQLLQAITAFQPWALVVSLGFDPYRGDPLSDILVDEACYRAIGSRLAGTGLPLLLAQEGGYALNDLPHLAEELVRGLAEGNAIE